MNKVKIFFLVAISFFFINSVNANDIDWSFGSWELYMSAVSDDMSKDAALFESTWGLYTLVLNWKEVEWNISKFNFFSYSGSTFFTTLQKDNWKWIYMEDEKKSEEFDDLDCYHDWWFYCVADKGNIWYIIYKSKILEETFDENITYDNNRYFNFDNSNNNWILLSKWGRNILLINWKTEVKLWYQEVYAYIYFSKDWDKFIILSSDVMWPYLLYKWKKIRFHSFWWMIWNKFNFIIEKGNWDSYDYYYNEIDLINEKISTKKIKNTYDIEDFKIIWDNHYSYIKSLISWWYSLVIDWKESKEYDSITYLWNSADYKYIIYSVEKNWESFLLINLKEFK